MAPYQGEADLIGGQALEPPKDFLRVERESRGFTVDHVQRETKIRKHILEALERGDFDVLPAAYVRNFVRKIARSVGADEKALLAQYESFVPKSLHWAGAVAPTGHGGHSSTGDAGQNERERPRRLHSDAKRRTFQLADAALRYWQARDYSERETPQEADVSGVHGAHRPRLWRRLGLLAILSCGFGLGAILTWPIGAPGGSPADQPVSPSSSTPMLKDRQFEEANDDILLELFGPEWLSQTPFVPDDEVEDPVTSLPPTASPADAPDDITNPDATDVEAADAEATVSQTAQASDHTLPDPPAENEDAESLKSEPENEESEPLSDGEPGV